MKTLIASIFAAALMLGIGGSAGTSTPANAAAVVVGVGHHGVVVAAHGRTCRTWHWRHGHRGACKVWGHRHHVKYCRAHHWRNHHRGACRLWGWRWIWR
jgi:hypothetical protein